MHKFRGIIVKTFVGILFALLILSFAVWGIGDTFRPGQHGNVVAEVGDQEISEIEFRRSFGRQYSQLQQNLGGSLSSEMLRDLGLPELVLGQLVTRGLLDQQAQDLGLTVTDDQIRRVIFAQDAFRDSLGQFDRFNFEQFLRANDMTEASFAREVRRDALQARISQALASGASVPDQLARMLYAYQEQRRTARFVEVPLPPADSIEAPDQVALEAFYEQVADRFRSPEYRSVTALWIRPDDFLEEIAISDAQLAEEYEARRESLIEPEEREIEQIVLLTEDKAEAAEAAMAGQADLAALGEAVEAGAPINIGRFSKDALSNTLGTELAELAFSLAPGEMGGPVRSDFGWHVLNVIDVSEGRDPSLEDVREELGTLVRREGAIEAVISLTNQLDDILAGGEGLEGASEQLTLELIRYPALDALGRDRSGQRPGGLASLDSFLQMVDEGEPGEESFLVEDGQNGYFVLRVDGVTPPANRPLNEVRTEVEAAYIEDQRRQDALARAERMAEQVRLGADLAKAAENEGLTVQTSNPMTRFQRDPISTPSQDFAPVLFGTEGDEPFIVEGERGAAVGVLDSVIAATPDADSERYEDVQQRLRRERANELMSLYLADLQSRYGVSTNQVAIDSIITSY